MSRHIRLMVDIFGERTACHMFRKIGPWYSRRMGPCHEFNRRITRLETLPQFDEIMEWYRQWRTQFLDERGELLPRFRSPAPVASFLLPESEPPKQQIPTPKGPVAYW